MISKQNYPNVAKMITLLHGNWNQPNGRVSQYAGVIMQALEDTDLPALKTVVDNEVGKSWDTFEGESKFPLAGKIIALTRKRRPAGPSPERLSCKCEDGWVRLIVFRMFRGVGSLRNDSVAPCSDCNHGDFSPVGLWYDRLVLGAMGRWDLSWPREALERWGIALMHTCEVVSKQERRAVQAAAEIKYNRGGGKLTPDEMDRIDPFDIRWPEDQDDMRSSLIRRGLFPMALIETNPPPVYG